jgi:hypothetical protein
MNSEAYNITYNNHIILPIDYNYHVISPIILGRCEALAARQDAKPPRVKDFVNYGYTPAAGALASHDFEFSHFQPSW